MIHPSASARRPKRMLSIQQYPPYEPMLIHSASNSSSSAEVIDQPASFSTLPVEIVASIVKIVAYDLVEKIKRDLVEKIKRADSKRRRRPIFKRLQYLLLTCKCFYQILCHWPVDIVVSTPTSKWNFPLHTRLLHEVIICKSMLEVFQQYHLLYFRLSTSIYYWVQPIDYGNLHLNPSFSERDFSCFNLSLNYSRRTITLLLNLGPYLDRIKRSLTTSEVDEITLNSIVKVKQPKYRVQEPMNGISVKSLHNGHPRLYHSVRDWRCVADRMIGGEMITTKVKEWWVWYHPPPYEILYFSGYTANNAWVFDAQSLEVHSSSDRIKLRKCEQLRSKSQPSTRPPWK
jgi:hypothetical protein